MTGGAPAGQEERHEIEEGGKEEEVVEADRHRRVLEKTAEHGADEIRAEGEADLRDPAEKPGEDDARTENRHYQSAQIQRLDETCAASAGTSTSKRSGYTG